MVIFFLDPEEIESGQYSLLDVVSSMAGRGQRLPAFFERQIMEPTEIIKQAVQIARRKGLGRRWAIGDVVAHEHEPITMLIKEILPHGLVCIAYGDIEHVVPIEEIFDPNLAKREALELACR